MWMECAGSLAMPENQAEGQSSSYADDGTASHTLAAWALTTGKDCADYPDATIQVGEAHYDIDEERIERIQSYVDDVRREALGGLLFTEYRVDLSKYLGMAPCWHCGGSGCPKCDGTGEESQGGTSDAVIIQPRKELLVIDDLKDGAGEKIYARVFNDDGTWKINHQLGLYGLGVLEDILLLGHKITRVILRIHQQKLNHIDEVEVTPEALFEFGRLAAEAAENCGLAMTLPVAQLDANGYLNPGEKTCRWCAAKVRCPAYTREVERITRMSFEDESEPVIPDSTEHLSRAYAKLDMVEQWVRAVKSQTWNAVNEGKEVLGKDGLPMKFVEGKQGNRKWGDETEAEAALVGQLGDNAYQPRKILTAPAADKLLNKKLTKHLWKDIFEPLITRAKGSMQLVLGSDPRPALGAGGAAHASEFDDEIGVE